MQGNAKALKRNNWECKGILIGPFFGLSFFSTTEIPSLCISLTVQVTESASGSNFAARMASRRNFFTSMPGRNSWPCGGIVRAEFFDFVETSQDPDVNRTTSTVTALGRSRPAAD